ncbi:FRG domain-containing protein [Shewanella sp. HL-SH8]|uniref:FRG domain-containing protein n=1 Tax=Shewanella sp. HL-SH8 TaxID=3436242 RepID=UPI003EBAFEB1
MSCTTKQYETNSSLEEVELESTELLFNHIGDHLLNINDNLGFRGHGDSNWSLQSTFVRFCISIGIEDETIRQVTLNKLKKAFTENLVVNGDLPEEVIEKTDIFQFGQHYGLPTPLLDWTHSPYVAAFFALSEQYPGGKPKNPVEGLGISRSLWVLDRGAVKHFNDNIMTHIRPKKSQIILQEEMLNEQYPLLDVIHSVNQYNKRQPFQQGFFTQHAFYNSLDAWRKRIDREISHAYPSPLLKKLTFKCTESERTKYLNVLDKMNINNRTLFPDITGSVLGAIETVRQDSKKQNHKAITTRLKDTD